MKQGHFTVSASTKLAVSTRTYPLTKYAFDTRQDPIPLHKP